MAISRRGMRTISVAERTYFWRTHMDTDFWGVHVVIVGEGAFAHGQRGQQLTLFVPSMFWDEQQAQRWRDIEPDARLVTPAIVHRAIALATRLPAPFSGAGGAIDVKLTDEQTIGLFRA